MIKYRQKSIHYQKFFSADFEYHIPKYQKTFILGLKMRLQFLFDDLYDFYELDNDDNYFLGSIVLIKK